MTSAEGFVLSGSISPISLNSSSPRHCKRNFVQIHGLLVLDCPWQNVVTFDLQSHLWCVGHPHSALDTMEASRCGSTGVLNHPSSPSKAPFVLGRVALEGYHFIPMILYYKFHLVPTNAGILKGHILSFFFLGGGGETFPEIEYQRWRWNWRLVFFTVGSGGDDDEYIVVLLYRRLYYPGL